MSILALSARSSELQRSCRTALNGAEVQCPQRVIAGAQDVSPGRRETEDGRREKQGVGNGFILEDLL